MSPPQIKMARGKDQKVVFQRVAEEKVGVPHKSTSRILVLNQAIEETLPQGMKFSIEFLNNIC